MTNKPELADLREMISDLQVTTENWYLELQEGKIKTTDYLRLTRAKRIEAMQLFDTELSKRVAAERMAGVNLLSNSVTAICNTYDMNRDVRSALSGAINQCRVAIAEDTLQTPDSSKEGV